MNIKWLTKETLKEDFEHTVHFPLDLNIYSFLTYMGEVSGSNVHCRVYYALFDGKRTILVIDEEFYTTILLKIHSFSSIWSYKNGKFKGKSIRVENTSYGKVTQQKVLDFYYTLMSRYSNVKLHNTIINDWGYKTMHDYYLVKYKEDYEKAYRKVKITEFLQ